MINLLPESEKQILTEMIRWKTVIICGCIIFIFFVSLILVLFSVKVSILSEVSIQKNILQEKEKSINTKEVEDLSREISQANENMSNLTNFYQNQPSFTDFLEKISNLLPRGIYLKSITINPLKIENNLFQVYLLGKASSVDDVISLNENLKKDANLTEINFPTETWLAKENFDFNLNFQVIIKK